jgi:hypothetical protein
MLYRHLNKAPRDPQELPISSLMKDAVSLFKE